MMRLLKIGAIAVALVCSAGAFAAERSYSEVSAKCSFEAIAAPADTTLTSVKSLDAPVRHCRIDGYVTTINPGPNKVNFMLTLPEKNNGRYLFTIQGGAAGFIPEPAQAQLRLGYAIASTDKGTRPANILDFSWRRDPAQALDWAHRGVHVVAGATQELARAYYRNETLKRFATGCSGGGDGTLSNAELYPTDFDGYVGAAMTTANLEINHMWGAIAQRINNDPSAWISPDEYKQIHGALMARYDGVDGAKDGLIWEPQRIKLTRRLLPFLSKAQLGTLGLIAGGLKTELGTSYPGYWLGNVTAMPGFLTGATRPPWQELKDYPAGFMVTATGAKGFNGPDYDILEDLDYNDRAALIADREFQARNGRYNFDPAKLSALKAAGGKLILWTGMADQAIPPGNILDYTEKLDQLHDKAGRETFVQTFLVPGLHHCATGEGAPTNAPDVLLEAMADWVETGVAPTSVIAANPVRDTGNIVTGTGALEVWGDTETRTFLLCPYPKRSRFIGGIKNLGKLDVNDAANWRCVP